MSASSCDCTQWLKVAGAVLLPAATWLALWSRLSKPFQFRLAANTGKEAEAVTYPEYEISGNVLVTGGCGFLGRHLVHTVAGWGKGVKKVVALDIAMRQPFAVPEGAPNSKRAGGNAEILFVQRDLTDKAALVALLKEHRITTVIHTASPPPNSPDRGLLERVNVGGTRAVIEACRDAGVATLVYTSSASVVWAGQGQTNADESTPYPSTFRDFYAETKAKGEQLVLAAGKPGTGLTTITIRPHGIYGAGCVELVGTAAEICRKGKQRFIVGSGDNVVDWTYVGNVVHSHLLAAQAAQGAAPGAAPMSGKAFFITDANPMPFWNFMNCLFIGLGYNPSQRRLPLGFLLVLASLAQGVVKLINTLVPRGKPLELTFSPSRLLIAGTNHWYNVSSARRLLEYKPLWSTNQGLYLTLKAFAHLRNPDPSPEVMALAATGNLDKLGLVVPGPTAVAAAAAVAAKSTLKISGELGANDAAVDPATLPTFTRAQVAAHATEGDMWVVIDNLVYDLTRYVEKHPGGVPEIMQHAGGDASKGFHGPQHPESVWGTLGKYIKGRLAPGETLSPTDF